MVHGGALTPNLFTSQSRFRSAHEKLSLVNLANQNHKTATAPGLRPIVLLRRGFPIGQLFNRFLWWKAKARLIAEGYYWPRGREASKSLIQLLRVIKN